MVLDSAAGGGSILEALPAIACGLLTYRFLPDRPADASFLSAEEKLQIHDVLAAEAAASLERGNLPYSNRLRILASCISQGFTSCF